MSNTDTRTLHISSTGINRLHGDKENTRTIEVEVSDYSASPSLKMKAKFKCFLDLTHKDGPRLELVASNHAIIGYVSLKAVV